MLQIFIYQQYKTNLVEVVTTAGRKTYTHDGHQSDGQPTENVLFHVYQV